MTDLARVPESEAEIARLYHELSKLGARVEGRKAPWGFGSPTAEEVLVLAAQAARRDPRLLWVAVELLARRYEVFDALRLRRAALRARWPAALAVAFEFAKEVTRSDELQDYSRFVTSPILPARGERFFLGTRAFAGEQARRDAEESLAEYKRWGYFGREEPFAKELGVAARGTLGPAERQNLLRRIASRRGEVTLAEYQEALRGRASARQATRDLAAAPFLVREGRTRGARWRYVEGASGSRRAPSRPFDAE